MAGRSRTRVCVLLSGGLDSAVLLDRLLRQTDGVSPVYVRCGLRWEAAELYWLRRLLKAVRSPKLAALHVVELPLESVYVGHWSLTGREVPSARSADRAVYLPGRNLLLLSTAAIVCAQQDLATIAIGLLRGNPFPDASPRFLAGLARCLTQALRHPIRIAAPLSRFNKAHLIRSSRAVPFASTFSCLNPRGHVHCGRCNKCAERQRAFRVAGALDPTSYATP